jgi:hypothetical protein
MKYKDHYKHLIEQRVNKKTYDDKYKLIQSYIDKMIDDSPGNNRDEKLLYVWTHHKDKMEKLLKGMRSLSTASTFGRIGKEPFQSYKSKFISDKYYIRFGDFPKGGKSKNHASGEMEIGISAYAAKWNLQKNKWEIIEDQLDEFSALEEFIYEITKGKGRPVYLVQGQELSNIGSDGEAMLDINNIKIVKKLEPHEFFSNYIGEDWYIQ